jgi:predicted dehydrogenase
MKFLIAGLGSIGRRHLRNLLALGETDILLYRTHKSTLPDDELRGFPVETDLQAALSHKPDAVIVANPTALHLDVAIPAAWAGCSLLLEKPVSQSLERLDELEKGLKECGGKVLVGYQFRFHPGIKQAIQLINSGALGRVLSVRAHWGEYLPGWHPWENASQSYSARADLGGGVILTLSHPLDYLRWMLGEVSQLWAFAGQLSGLHIDVEDTAEIGLQFSNGAIGSLHLDYNQRPAAHSFEVIGSLGTLVWDNADGDVMLFQADADYPHKPMELRTFAAPLNFERNTMFVSEMRHFIDVIRGKAEPVCTLEDGKAALQLALGALESARESKKWVRSGSA